MKTDLRIEIPRLFFHIRIYIILVAFNWEYLVSNNVDLNFTSIRWNNWGIYTISEWVKMSDPIKIGSWIFIYSAWCSQVTCSVYDGEINSSRSIINFHPYSQQQLGIIDRFTVFLTWQNAHSFNYPRHFRYNKKHLSFIISDIYSITERVSPSSF